MAKPRAKLGMAMLGSGMDMFLDTQAELFYLDLKSPDYVCIFFNFLILF